LRGPREHNGGILVRSEGAGFAGSRFYEIQIHNVAEAHYPTGSLYHYKRAVYPRIEDEVWFPMQIRLEGPRCLVRINGDKVLEYDGLENVDEGAIEIQATARVAGWNTSTSGQAALGPPLGAAFQARGGREPAAGPDAALPQLDRSS
jgi:hypothetical protein